MSLSRAGLVMVATSSIMMMKKTKSSGWWEELWEDIRTMSYRDPKLNSWMGLKSHECLIGLATQL